MYFSSSFFGLICFILISLAIIQDVACKKNVAQVNDEISKQSVVARLNRRSLLKRQGSYYTQGYQTSPTTQAANAVYPPQVDTTVQAATANAYNYYPQTYAPAPAAPQAAAPAAAAPAAAASNPLELGDLLSNLKLPALPSLASAVPAAPAAGSASAAYPYYYGALAKAGGDDDDDEEEDDDESDDDKNNEDDDDEE